MGNRNNRINRAVPDQNQALIQGNNDNIDVSLLVDHPTFKKVFALKNPIYLKKETLEILKDSEDLNSFYIKFNYDSLVNFDLFISFNVVKNQKSKKIKIDNNDYILSYIPSKNFESQTFKISNLEGGQNIEFLDKNVKFNINEFTSLKLVDNEVNSNNSKTNNSNSENNIINSNIEINSNSNLNQINTSNNSSNPSANPLTEHFDVAIEMKPIFSTINDKDNDMIFVTLCDLVTEENETHNHKIHPRKQRIRKQGMWVDLHDVFNSALDSGECLICCSAIRNTIFLPCKHSCTCNQCAHSLRMRSNPCPICKNPIDDLLILEMENDKKDMMHNSNSLGIDTSSNNFLGGDDSGFREQGDIRNQIENNINIGDLGVDGRDFNGININIAGNPNNAGVIGGDAENQGDENRIDIE